MSHINVEKKLNFAKKLNNVNNRVLKIENLALTYDGKRILDNINMFMERGETLITILGPNGGGKTSLVKAIAGINKSCTGSIVFADNIKIGYMPQNFSISN